MNYRRQKQIIIGLATLIAVLIFSWGVAAVLRSGQPLEPLSPLSNDLNKGDATKALKPLEITLEKFFKIEPTTYDAVALIKNVNPEHGASRIVYEFTFSDENGAQLYTGSGKTFILPDRDRYIVVPSVRVSKTPDTVSFRIMSVEWERLHPFSPLGLRLGDTRLSRDKENNITVFSGIVENGSPYNLQNAEVQVALYAPDGEVVSAGQTNMQTLLRGDDRSFQISWPYIVPPNLDIDARVESNFLENSNFIRDYAP